MYAKPKDLALEYAISRSMVSKIIQEMQESKRYPRSAIIGGTCLRVSKDAFQDYMENREDLKHPNMAKYIKPYKGR